MATAKERILEVLRSSGRPLCDDCMVEPASLSVRQVSFSTCTQLEKDGLVRRYKDQCSHCGKYKTVNTLADRGKSLPATADSSIRVTPSKLEAPRPVSSDEGKPWHWEGNVQSALASWLAINSYRILQVANTRTHEAGKDIIAHDPEGKELWVTVKGYPEKKTETSTNPSTQARHWFSHAIFDTVLYRNENPEVKIAVGLPAGFLTYRGLADRIKWYKETVPFTFFWVSEDGSVTVE